jgi:hypothetical protein
MIVLDTNVVSEPMRPGGNPRVQQWLDRQAAETLYLTATSLSELLTGIEMSPEGKRKQGLDTALAEVLARLFGDRILPFDRPAAIVYARLVRRARTAGHMLSVVDAQIAAIATVHKFTVATRDILPFQAAGVPVINPWQAPE